MHGGRARADACAAALVLLINGLSGFTRHANQRHPPCRRCVDDGGDPCAADPRRLNGRVAARHVIAELIPALIGPHLGQQLTWGIDSATARCAVTACT